MNDLKEKLNKVKNQTKKATKISKLGSPNELLRENW